MKYQLERRASGNLESTTLETLAEQYKLEMRVREAVPELWPGRRYYASFANVEVMEGGMLCGTCGRGATPENAIAQYAELLRGKEIAIGAYTEARRNVTLPDVLEPGDWTR